MDNTKRSEAARGDRASHGRDGHMAKRVRLRERDEDPPPLLPKLSYSAAVMGEPMQEAEEGLAWSEEESVEYEEGDLTLINGDGALELSNTFRTRLDKQWERAVVVKLLGRRIGYKMLCNRLRTMWTLKGPMKIVDLDFDYFLINFVEEEDFLYTLTEGPWVILGHVLSVQRWNPQFRPSQGKISRAVVWVRFPELPISRYHPVILNALGNMVGQTIKIDAMTKYSQRGRFARVAVDIDLSTPLRARVTLDGEEFRVAYEGLPQICFSCGVVGHASGACPNRSGSSNSVDSAAGDTNHGAMDVDNGAPPIVSSSPTTAQKEMYGPWIQVQRRPRRTLITANNQARKIDMEKILASKFGSRYMVLKDSEIMEDSNVDFQGKTAGDTHEAGDRRTFGDLIAQNRGESMGQRIEATGSRDVKNSKAKGKEIKTSGPALIVPNNVVPSLEHAEPVVIERKNEAQQASNSRHYKQGNHTAINIGTHKEVVVFDNSFAFLNDDDMEIGGRDDDVVDYQDDLPSPSIGRFKLPPNRPPDKGQVMDMQQAANLLSDSQMEVIPQTSSENADGVRDGMRLDSSTSAFL